MTGFAGSQDSHSPLERVSGAEGPEGAQPKVGDAPSKAPRHDIPSHATAAWGGVGQEHLPTSRESSKPKHAKYDRNMNCGKCIPHE